MAGKPGKAAEKMSALLNRPLLGVENKIETVVLHTPILGALCLGLTSLSEMCH